jgi:hypothetical protein
MVAVAPVPTVNSKENVRSQPSRSAEILSGLPAQLLGQEGEWYHVRLSDGKRAT